MQAFLEGLFQALFKYRPLIFERGDFTFASSWPIWILVGGGLVVAAPVIWMYTRARGRSGLRDRILMSVARVAIFALVAFCLLKPTLLVKRAVPQQSYVAVLLDDSRSMRIADDEKRPRTQFIAESFGVTGPLAKSLSNRFKLRYFRFSSDLDRIAGVQDLSFAGTKTRLGDALDQVRQEMSGVPLAGVVVVSDGADNAPNPFGPQLLPMKASGVPVYTVGVGREKFDKDIQINRVETPATVLKGSSLVVDAVITQHGYSGQKARLDVEDGGRIVERQEFTLPSDGEAATVRVKFTANEPGARKFRFHVTPMQGEVIANNNDQEAIIDVENRREKILYFEGEPRWELKYIHLATQDDPNIQVVSLTRTAENKYSRRQVDSPEELAAAFPQKRDELFAYRGLILGSVEASFFTHDQLQMIADFVNKRGGGLLVLGGRHSFSEGGYAGTPVAEVLPVLLEGNVTNREYFGEFKVKPTRAGLTHAATQLAKTERESEERYKSLPALSAANVVTKAKPGATTLLSGSATSGAGEQVILAYQRYGRGISIALPVQDSWLWQMHADMTLEDLTHETFWRQLTRWLVHDVPMPIQAALSSDRVEPGERLVLTADVADSSFMQVNDGQVTARVTTPSGDLVEVPMEWTGARDGEYRASMALRETGMHQVRIEARRGDHTLGADVVHVNAGPSSAEFFDAHLNATTLKRVAEETGGRYYTPANVATLADDISYTGRGDTVTERMDLWDMPIIFILLFLLIAFEWVFRRVRGLA
ncbi:MAG: hypothetical protein ACRENP_23080 [Longimicrobiales bacterium]